MQALSLAGQRARQIAIIKKERGSRVITMVHRQETRAIFSIPFSRMIDLEDAQLIGNRLPPEQAATLVDKLAGGQWTHDYALIAKEAAELGLTVKKGIRASILELISPYPQPVREQPSIEFLPLNPSAASAEPLCVSA